MGNIEVLREQVTFLGETAWKDILLTAPIFEFSVDNLFFLLSFISSNSWYFMDFLKKSFICNYLSSFISFFICQHCDLLSFSMTSTSLLGSVLMRLRGLVRLRLLKLISSKKLNPFCMVLTKLLFLLVLVLLFRLFIVILLLVLVYQQLQMRVIIKTIETHVRQPFPSLLLDVSHKHSAKYIFNVPSQTQRFFSEIDFALNPLTNFFFTRTSTNALSGLPSLMYLCAGINKRVSLRKIYGDSRLFQYLEELKYRLGFGIAGFSYCSWDGQLRKGIRSANIIRKLSQSSDFNHKFHHLQEYIERQVQDSEINNALNKYNVEKRVYEDKSVRIIPITTSQIQTDYIIHIKDRFQVVYTIIVVHHSNQNYVRKLMQDQQFKNVFKERPLSSIVTLHLFDNSQIARSAQFDQFVKSIPSEVEQLFSSKTFKNNEDNITEFHTIHKHQYLINKFYELYPSYFPNYQHEQRSIVSNLFSSASIIQHKYPEHKVTAFNGQAQYTIFPESHRGYSPAIYDYSVPLNHKNPIKTPDIPLKHVLATMFKEFDPVVTFLGTSATISWHLRDTSCILVENQNWLMMWDCGTGSFPQFSDHFGTQVSSKLLKTKIIFITHCHSDHVLGVMEFLSERNKMKDNPQFDKVFLVIPANMLPWYHRYCQIVEDVSVGCEVLFIQTLLQEKYQLKNIKYNKQQNCNRYERSIIKGDWAGMDLKVDYEFYKQEWNELTHRPQYDQGKVKQSFQEFMKNNKIKQFKPVPVDHCPQAFGICLQHTSGVKISYSGDTRPWPPFIEAAKNSTLLIHEATFHNTHVKDAIIKSHSTVDQAIQVAMKTKSWKTALTHFNQLSFSEGEMIDLKGYLKFKIQQFADKHVFLACDHLKFKLSEAEALPSITRQLSKQISLQSRRQLL